MVLVADNAPYHHKRVIGSLGGLMKKNLVGMMVRHSVSYLDLPLTTDGRTALSGVEGKEWVQDCGDCVRINFKSILTTVEGSFCGIDNYDTNKDIIMYHIPLSIFFSVYSQVFYHNQLL